MAIVLNHLAFAIQNPRQIQSLQLSYSNWFFEKIIYKEYFIARIVDLNSMVRLNKLLFGCFTFYFFNIFWFSLPPLACPLTAVDSRPLSTLFPCFFFQFLWWFFPALRYWTAGHRTLHTWRSGPHSRRFDSLIIYFCWCQMPWCSAMATVMWNVIVR